MTTFVVKDHSNGNTRECDSRADAEETKNDMVSLGADPTQLEIIPPGEGENTAKDASELLAEETGRPKEEFESEQDMPDVDELEEHKPDGGTEVVEPPEPAENFEDELPESPSVDTDPLEWIPSEFQDTIDGTIAINRKGFEVLAHHYNISCETDMVDYTDSRVIHKATATTENGTVYTAYGEAHSSEDKDEQLVRLSDTRSFKRAVSRATGIGMVAVEELQNEL